MTVAQDDVRRLRNELGALADLVESALVHVSHGGPTRAEAEVAVKRARELLKETRDKVPDEGTV